MKIPTYRLYTHPKYAKVIEWGKLITITGGSQAIIQVIGLLSGILIIRLLSTQEYAFYTLANTMLGTMTVLSDGGISTSVMAQGGQVWKDKEKLGAVLATGLNLRRKFAVGSLLVSVPILFYLLAHHGANWLTSILIVSALIPAFFAALSDSLLEIAPKLHQDVKLLQANQLYVSVGRLLLVGGSLFIFPWTFLALLANGLPRIYGNIKLKNMNYKYADRYQEPDIIIKSEILKAVKLRLPESIYYCLSSQLNIWLISLFGSTMALASLGALGRISMVINLFSVLFATLVIPRFARLPEIKSLLFNYIISIFIGALILGILCMGITFIFSSQLLFIIGNAYKNFQSELLLVVLGAYISFLQGCFFSLLVNRDWIINPILFILLSIMATIIAAIFTNVSTLQGVVIFNIIISSAQVLILIIFCFFRIKKIPET